MKGKGTKYKLYNRVSAICMIVALIWLTISAPFVYASQLEQVRMEKLASTGLPLDHTDDDSCNPFSNTTEEKTPGNGSSFSEEYHTHDHHADELFASIARQFHQRENTGTYNAFHGELLVPPPNAA